MSYSVPNKQGKTILIDEEDRDLLPPCGRLAVSVAGRKPSQNQYAALSINSQTTHFHRLLMKRILGRPLRKGERVDHINNDTLDNRRSNLRVISHSENVNRAGAYRNNTSGYKGVYKAHRKWAARIWFNGEGIPLGSFDTSAEAAAVYDAAALRYFGPFAYQNTTKRAA